MFIVNKREFRSIRHPESDFYFSTDNITYVPRASLEIDRDCPGHLRDIIHHCVSQGWLKAVANVKDQEMVWEKLQK